LINHDKLFKELLTTFFVEFLELFVPGVVPYLDKTSITFLDKELFASEKRREADIVVSVRFKEMDSFFLIHTEAQAQHQAEFPIRMFHYFAALHEKFKLPVYQKRRKTLSFRARI
jgi:Putative transposase, YhgA-like